MEKGDRLLHNSVTTVALAINGTSNSKHIVQWALNKFISGGGVMFKLLHVRSRIKMVPSPIGNLPVEQVQDDVASAYKKEEEWKTEVMLRPYKNMCSAKQIETEVVILEADDVAEAISKEVTENSISMLVIGASSKNAIIRKLWGGNLSSRIAECTPSFCTVYVVSRGKLSSVRASAFGTDEIAPTSVTKDSIKEENDSSAVFYSSSNNSPILKSGNGLCLSDTSCN